MMAKDKAKKDDKQSKDSKGPRMVNRKAWHDYSIGLVVECGLELVGTEVKSLRAGQAKIDDGFAIVRGGQVFLVGVNIATYPQASAAMQHEPTRQRRLLVHRRQIAQLLQHVTQKGNTLIPLAVYFKRGWAKCELGLASGKKMFDKRDDIRKREQQRDIAREMSRRRRG
jgi:SsrA-binding protein